MVKKLLAAFLAILIGAGLASCADDNDAEKSGDDGKSVSERADDTDDASVADDKSDSENTTRLSRSERKKIEEASKTEPLTESSAVSEIREIIPGISLGMDEDEVIAVVGEAYDNMTVGSRCVNYCFNYDVDSIPTLGIDIKSALVFEFNEKRRLVSYGCGVGIDAMNNIYTEYTSGEITDEFNRLADLLGQFGGEGRREAGHCSWSGTSIGEISLLGYNLYNGGESGACFLLRVSEGAVESGGFERDDEFCIIPQVYFGFHEDYIKSIFGLGAEREECGDTDLCSHRLNYYVDEIEQFNITLPSQMFFEFDADGKLMCYGYKIGITKNENGEKLYPCTDEEILDTYDRLQTLLLIEFDNVQSGSPDENDISGLIKSIKCDTGMGMILLACSKNAGGEQDANEIIFSCSAGP